MGWKAGSIWREVVWIGKANVNTDISGVIGDVRGYALKWRASGWWTIMAEVDCSGTIS